MRGVASGTSGLMAASWWLKKDGLVAEGAENREGSSKRGSMARGEIRRKMIMIFLQFCLVKSDLKFT